MITLLAGFLFSSIEYQFFPYMLIAYTAAFRRIASEQEVRESRPHAPNAALELGPIRSKYLKMQGQLQPCAQING